MGCGPSQIPRGTYRLWSPVSRAGNGIMKRHPTKNKMLCNGTFEEPDVNTNMTTWEKPQGPRNHNFFVLLFEDAGGQKYALKGSGEEITIEETDKTDNEGYVFQFKGVGGFTMLKHFKSKLYLGCDHKGAVTLVENAHRMYPNPQTVFLLNKVGSVKKTIE